MKKTLIAMAVLCLAVPTWAQKQELAFTLGATANGTLVSSPPQSVKASSGTAMQINYAYRFWGNAAVAVSGEFHFLANPQRRINATSPLLTPICFGCGVTHDYASLYLTPGIRVKLNPKGRIEPYGAIGGGYALYEQSATTIGGAPNPAPHELSRAAFMYGGGGDVKVLHWIAVRGEVRDFYTGRPALNVSTLRGGQHNVVVSGGFALRWGN